MNHYLVKTPRESPLKFIGLNDIFPKTRSSSEPGPSVVKIS